MSDKYELIVAGLGGSGPKSTAVNFTVVEGIRTWTWIRNEMIATHNIRAGVTLLVSDVRAIGEPITHWENNDGESVKLDNPKQQLLLGGKMSIAQPSLEPMEKLEVVSA